MWDRRFLDMAALVSTWSKDPSTKTGAVIVRPDRSVCSVGFNGFPRGMPDATHLYEDRGEKYSRIVHCEINAQLFAREPIVGYTLYTYPFISCDRCAVQLIQAGISRMVSWRNTCERWEEAFKKTRKYAQECGVEVMEIDP